MLQIKLVYIDYVSSQQNYYSLTIIPPIILSLRIILVCVCGCVSNTVSNKNNITIIIRNLIIEIKNDLRFLQEINKWLQNLKTINKNA